MPRKPPAQKLDIKALSDEAHPTVSTRPFEAMGTEYGKMCEAIATACDHDCAAKDLR